MAATESSSSIPSSESIEAVGNKQQTEVASIKAAFPSRCRVISNVGQYSFSVTVQPENLDVTIKFQLHATYPQTAPDILIRSESLTKEHIANVTAMLQSSANKLTGQTMMQNLILQAEEAFRSLGLKPGKSTQANKDTFLDNKPKKEKKKRRKFKSEDEVEDKKLPPMKTADDVVKRIIWDEALDKDSFVVGYFDRFRGLVEKYFSAFSWEDLASVDYDVLAVPKHRIQYFKYKDVKVWDKPRRIDNVFGSADGTKTIDIVMREVEEQERLENSARNEAAESAGVVVRNDDSNADSFTDDSDESSDEDDGIVVTIGASTNIGTAGAQNGLELKNADGEHREEENEADPYWRNKLRPNYFLCVRITSPSIMEAVGNIQDHLMEKEPRYAECCIPGAALHMTLNTLGLDTAEQLQQCIDVLNRIRPDLEQQLPQSPLHLRGVSHFYNRVIYAQVHYKKEFIHFCNHLKMLLREAGVQIRDGYDFVPHVTIMKVTRPVARLMGTKNIDAKLYAPFNDTEFGDHEVSSIYLCSMGNERRPDGFYLTPIELHFKK